MQEASSGTESNSMTPQANASYNPCHKLIKLCLSFSAFFSSLDCTAFTGKLFKNFTPFVVRNLLISSLNCSWPVYIHFFLCQLWCCSSLVLTHLLYLQKVVTFLLGLNFSRPNKPSSLQLLLEQSLHSLDHLQRLCLHPLHFEFTFLEHGNQNCLQYFKIPEEVPEEWHQQ